MLDINKYLETQLALAKQKCDDKNKRHSVSTKSKTAAEIISNKQSSSKVCLNKPISVSKKSVPELNKNCRNEQGIHFDDINNYASRDSDNDSEYLPSCEEDESDNIYVPTAFRVKQNIKKIIDDGDINHYNKRILNWRNDLTAAQSGNYDGISFTADIQYVLDGNNDPEENYELKNGLCVPIYIWKQLYKYQRTGVKWLWELHQVQSGGLLGDEMGLGKTVQIIAFLAGLSKTDHGSWGGLGPTIIVAPATVIYQWVSHFHYWYPHLRVVVLHHSGSHVGNHNKLIRELHQSHGILLITYAGVVKYNKDLTAIKWHYIILDEGHKIRNPDTQVSKFVKKFQTPHRLLITGSPMQNNLQELWSLFDFMRPGLLGTYAIFMEYFAVPITQGGYANASQLQEATALEIAKALKNIINPYMLRRTKAEVQEHIKLPEKNEQVLFCALSQEQKDLYMGYLMSATVRSILDRDSRYGDPLRARVLVALSTLRKICNHPDLYLFEAQEESEGIDERFGYWKRSGKMTVVHSLLKIWQKQGHRALIFTQSRAMLCILEQFLQRQEYKYLKMDGTVSVAQRQNLIKTFNNDIEYLVFLATTRVGGLGVNLTGADRVIIYDPDWNPATDSQAKERAWRIGQKKNVTVYRLLSAGTIEEKIYQRQIFKQYLSNRILIDPHQKNVLTTSTLQGLFTLEELNCDGDTETASLFKHTKVNVNNKSIEKSRGNTVESNDAKKKLEEMRKKAREISKKISQNVKRQLEPAADPREKYRKRRELLLNPPIIEEPEINVIDDKITNVPFENILSELDIVNLHTKRDYEKNLIKDAINSQSIETREGEITDEEGAKNDEDNLKTASVVSEEPLQSALTVDLLVKTTNVEEAIEKSTEQNTNVDKQKKRVVQRKHNSLSKDTIENLVAIKRVKKKKYKKTNNFQHDDDYVLNKLFARAAVKNALQHDVVVGLAEKEKIHKMKEEATKKARRAIRAIRVSSK